MPVTTAAINRQLIPYLILMGMVLILPAAAVGYRLVSKNQQKRRKIENAGS